MEMNLDELVKSMRKVSHEEVVQKLADYLQEWKTDKRNPVDYDSND